MQWLVIKRHIRSLQDRGPYAWPEAVTSQMAGLKTDEKSGVMTEMLQKRGLDTHGPKSDQHLVIHAITLPPSKTQNDDT